MFNYLILELYMAKIIGDRYHNKINFKILVRKGRPKKKKILLEISLRSKMPVYLETLKEGFYSPLLKKSVGIGPSYLNLI